MNGGDRLYQRQRSPLAVGIAVVVLVVLALPACGDDRPARDAGVPLDAPRRLPDAPDEVPPWVELPEPKRMASSQATQITTAALSLDGEGRPVVVVAERVLDEEFRERSAMFVSAWDEENDAWAPLGPELAAAADHALVGSGIGGLSGGVLAATTLEQATLDGSERTRLHVWQPERSSWALVREPQPRVRAEVFFDPFGIIGLPSGGVATTFHEGSAPDRVDAYVFGFDGDGGWRDLVGGPLGRVVDATDSFEPQIAGGDDGSIYATFVTRQVASPTDLARQRVLVLRAGADEWEPVGNKIGNNVTAPTLAVGPDGELYATWEQLTEYNNDPAGSLVPVVRWNPGRGVWDAVGDLVQPDRDVLGMVPTLAIDSTGAPIVAWLEYPASLLRPPGASIGKIGRIIRVRRWSSTEATWQPLPTPLMAPSDASSLVRMTMRVTPDDRIVIATNFFSADGAAPRAVVMMSTRAAADM